MSDDNDRNEDRELSLARMNHSWERELRGVFHYVYIRPSEIVIGSGQGHTDNAVACSFAEFLSGKYHDLIEYAFGADVLSEVISTVRLAPGTREHRQEQADINRLRDYLGSIPVEKQLARFCDKEAIDENGYLNYGAMSGYATESGTVYRLYTRLESERKILVYGPTETVDGQRIKFYRHAAYLISKDNGREMPVNVGIAPSGGLADSDTFYIVTASSFVVLDDEGNRRSPESDEKVFGERLRINNVLRSGNDFCFHYSWFSNEYPRGFLRYDKHECRFAGRYELP